MVGKMITNKRGWIRVVEAFVAVLIVTGFVLIALNRGYIGNDISTQVYELEYSTLKEIATNDSIRTDILELTDIPIESNIQSFPRSINDKVKERIPNYLECTSKICALEDLCALSTFPKNKNIYADWEF